MSSMDADGEILKCTEELKTLILELAKRPFEENPVLMQKIKNCVEVLGRTRVLECIEGIESTEEYVRYLKGLVAIEQMLETGEKNLRQMEAEISTLDL